MESVKDELRSILNGLTRIGGVEGSAVITSDGLMVAAELSPGINDEHFAAMTATMTGAARKLAEELKRGLAKRIVIDCEKGTVVSSSAGDVGFLVALIVPGANLGLVLVALKKASAKVGRVLG